MTRRLTARFDTAVLEDFERRVADPLVDAAAALKAVLETVGEGTLIRTLSLDERVSALRAAVQDRCANIVAADRVQSSAADARSREAKRLSESALSRANKLCNELRDARSSTKKRHIMRELRSEKRTLEKCERTMRTAQRNLETSIEALKLGTTQYERAWARPFARAAAAAE
jgi:hypothetical protein